MLFLVIMITIVVAIVVDHIRFNRQVNEFIDTADEFVSMYNLAIDALKKEGTDVEFQGQRFYLYVEEGDYKSLVKQVELAVCEVLDKYDLIDKRYFMEMDDDLFSEIEMFHRDAENIQNAVRITKWRNGWK